MPSLLGASRQTDPFRLTGPLLVPERQVPYRQPALALGRQRASTPSVVVGG